MSDDLLVTDDAGVRWITLNRPDAGNALTPTQQQGIVAALEEASSLLAVRCVVLTAAGERHFCTGADLRAPREAPPRPADAPEQTVGDVSRMIARGAQRTIGAILDCEKPVIGSINGTAAGIGSHIALACDLIVAADTARFVEVFIRRALIADGGGCYLLPRLVGVHKAKELLFLGEDVPAAEAHRLGIVHQVVPAAELRAATETLATRLATSPTPALSLMKRLVNTSLDTDRATAFAAECAAVEVNMKSHDANEGVAAFVERREPNYLGW